MAIDLTAVARVVGVETNFKDFRAGRAVFLPQRIAVLAQGADAATYSTEKRTVTTEYEAGELYGFGSPIHQILRQLKPAAGRGVGTVPVTVYPLEAPSGGAASTGAITPASAPTGPGLVRVTVGGVVFPAVGLNDNQTVGDVCNLIADLINGTTWAPVTAVASASEVSLTAKWQGVTGDDVKITVEETGSAAVDFAVTDMAGGAGVAAITDALTQVGNVWETIFINSQPVTDTATLDELSQFGETRWGETTRKPAIVITGTNTSDYAALSAITDARPTDRTNVVIPAPGSKEQSFIVAAMAAGQIAQVAQNNPAKDYARQPLAAAPGADGDQWGYVTRDAAVKAGLSTTEIRDGRVELSDTVTCYHPAGVEEPGYRYVCDIVKLQNIIFNIDLRFATARWDGAPLILDDQPTVNPDAKRPKDAVAEMYGVIDGLGLEALIADPEFAKANTTAAVNPQNPKRLDLQTSVKLSGNANIINVGLNFGFFFG